MKREASTIIRTRSLPRCDILETYEAGIELTGTEVRSLREPLYSSPTASPSSEAAVYCCAHIPPYADGNIANPDPDRKPEAAAAWQPDPSWEQVKRRTLWRSCPIRCTSRRTRS